MDLIIDTNDFGEDNLKVKTTINTFKPGIIEGELSYPNGFNLEFSMFDETINLSSNWGFIEQADGSLKPIKP